jgi:hypothetical protein
MTRDLRRYARQTNVRLFIGFVILLFLVGDGIIYVVYGRNAAILGLTCMLFGLTPLLLIWLALWILDLIVRRVNQD